MSGHNEASNEPLRPNLEASADFGVGHLGFSRGPYDDNVLKSTLSFRAKFVDAMGWNTETADELPFALNWLEQDGYERIRKEVDRYDLLDETRHLLLTERDQPEPIASLRLTKVNSVEESLSWSMFEGASEPMQAWAYAHEDGATMRSLADAARGGKLWDLTRFVSPVDRQIDADRLVGGMLELFGAGYGTVRNECPESEREDIKWMFTGTKLLVLALEHTGIQFDIVARGKISSNDHGKSYFCVVRPEAGVRYIQSGANEPDLRFSNEHLTNGLLKANAL